MYVETLKCLSILCFLLQRPDSLPGRVHLLGPGPSLAGTGARPWERLATPAGDSGKRPWNTHQTQGPTFLTKQMCSFLRRKQKTFSMSFTLKYTDDSLQKGDISDFLSFHLANMPTLQTTGNLLFLLSHFMLFGPGQAQAGAEAWRDRGDCQNSGARLRSPASPGPLSLLGSFLSTALSTQQLCSRLSATSTLWSWGEQRAAGGWALRP